MMRTPFSLILAAATAIAVTAFSAVPPAAKVPRFDASMSLVGGVVRVKWTIAATPSDSLTIAVSATGQPTTKRMYSADAKTDSLDYPKPAPGATITISLLGTNWRGTRSASAQIISGTYVEPDTLVTPPTITNFQLLPASVSLAPGAQQQFCAVLCYSDGTCGVASNGPPSASCQQAFQSWLSTRSI